MQWPPCSAELHYAVRACATFSEPFLKHDLACMQEQRYISADSIVNDAQADANGL